MGDKAIEAIVLLSIVNACFAFTVSETKLFAGLRERCHGISKFLGELASCGYCLGHWSAFALVAIYRPRLFEAWAPLDYVATALVIAWLSAFQWICMCWLIQRTGK
jgi:hypothetical protein